MTYPQPWTEHSVGLVPGGRFGREREQRGDEILHRHLHRDEVRLDRLLQLPEMRLDRLRDGHDVTGAPSTTSVTVGPTLSCRVLTSPAHLSAAVRTAGTKVLSQNSTTDAFSGSNRRRYFREGL